MRVSFVVVDVASVLHSGLPHLGVPVVVNLISFVSCDVFLSVVPVVGLAPMCLLVLLTARAFCWLAFLAYCCWVFSVVVPVRVPPPGPRLLVSFAPPSPSSPRA
jgi:hypothetical protein